ncbi:hypothetical protein GlitD10_1354 [Gloeomargarita lithophora Alchichica-D10]|uniref:Uncharacterized protein n=1 Tax=Gloeomargarita lithophora Alchichica-D10 TaxID=1188229 RepID=A0A1J0ACN1_9CYAN|nr:hypothetical protein GlitD10_1354 [Gloeomargarita lithophora Alchichica-D10]
MFQSSFTPKNECNATTPGHPVIWWCLFQSSFTPKNECNIFEAVFLRFYHMFQSSFTPKNECNFLKLVQSGLVYRFNPHSLLRMNAILAATTEVVVGGVFQSSFTPKNECNLN